MGLVAREGLCSFTFVTAIKILDVSFLFGRSGDHKGSAILSMNIGTGTGTDPSIGSQLARDLAINTEPLLNARPAVTF